MSRPAGLSAGGTGLRFAHSMPLHSDAAAVLQKALIFPGSRPREGGAGSRGNDDYVVIQRIPK